MMMEGRGEILTSVKIDLEQFYLVLLFPGIHISTAEAYASISPAMPKNHLGAVIREPVNLWKELIFNDFEKFLFPRYPQLKEMKEGLYRAGAVYASMSGSGSSMYGIFSGTPDLPVGLGRYLVWKGKIGDSSIST
jgi:4-diphosphocytidyl-2-C-methyl-D-erythritol kinase